MKNITFSPSFLSRKKPAFIAAVRRTAVLLLLACFAQNFAGAQASIATPFPSAANFGTVNLGSASMPATLTFTFSSPGTGVSVQVLTLGAKNGDFADTGAGSCTINGPSHSYASGDTCTVSATLTPRFNGPRHGAVQLVNAAGQVVALAYVYGIGSGPQIIYPSAAQSTVGGSNFTAPIGVAVDGSGNVYVPSANLSSVIQEYVAATGNVVTVGSGFSFPAGVAVDGAGNIYVADTYNDAIKKIVVASGDIVTLGGGYKFNTPGGVAVDGSGNVYVADFGNSAVEEILASDGTVHLLGSGFVAPTGIAVDGVGNVYVADQFDGAGKIKEIVQASGTVMTLGSGFNYPHAVTVDGLGNVYVADTYNNAVKVISVTDGSIRSIGSGLNTPGGISVDAGGNVYISDFGNDRVVVENYATAPALAFATPTKVDTLDTADGPQSFLLANIGSAPLTLTPTNGPNPSASSSFSVTSGVTTCARTSGTSAAIIASNATCTYGVNFAPLMAGTIQGQLTLLDNNTTAFGPGKSTSQAILLSGTGFGTASIVVSGTLPVATVASSYSASFTATGGAAPYNFSATGLPPGLTLSSGGVLSGTPTVAGKYTIIVTATDMYSFSGTATFELPVGDSALDFQFTLDNTGTQLINAGSSAQYSLSVSPAGGVFPFPVSFTVTGLPNGYQKVFTPATVTPGLGSVKTLLTIQSNTTFALQQSNSPLAIFAAVLLLPFTLSRKLRGRIRRPLMLVLFLCGTVAATAGLTGCVGYHVNPATYNVVITATGNGHQHAINTVLQVQPH
jgi:hypothetical protein